MPHPSVTELKKLELSIKMVKYWNNTPMSKNTWLQTVNQEAKNILSYTVKLNVDHVYK